MRRVWKSALLTLAALSLASSAQAVQFTPGPNARLHFLGTGPGAEWNTGGLAVNGEVDYNATTEAVDPGLLRLTGMLDVLNYLDPDQPCNTACSFDFAPDLAFELQAQFSSLTVNNLGPTSELIVTFDTAANGSPDLVMTDPTDGTVVLTSMFIPGTFMGIPVDPLTAKLTFITATGNPIGAPTVLGLSVVDPGTPYGMLFQDGIDHIRLDLSTFFDFIPNLSTLALQTAATGVVPSFISEGQGQVFRVSEGDFIPIPEPSTGVLLLGGLLGLRVLRARPRA